MRLIYSFCMVLLLGIFTATSGCGAMSADGESAFSASASSELRDFTLMDLQGKQVNLKSLLHSKKAVLVNFWATWCPPCREEIPGLMRLQEKYKNDKFTILGVDVGESQGKVARFVQSMRINYPVVLDMNMAVSRRYNVVGIPTSILMNSQGEVLGVYHAYNSKLVADVEEALQ